MLTQETMFTTIDYCPTIPYGLCYSWDRINARPKSKVKTSTYNWRRTDKNKSAMGSFTMYAKDGHLELWNVRIGTRYQGKGYGQQMIKEAIEMANGIEVVLYVRKHNKTAIHVYEKCGFNIVEGCAGNSLDDGLFKINDMFKMVYPGKKLDCNNCPDGICGYWGEERACI